MHNTKFNNFMMCYDYYFSLILGIIIWAEVFSAQNFYI